MGDITGAVKGSQDARRIRFYSLARKAADSAAGGTDTTRGTNAIGPCRRSSHISPTRCTGRRAWRRARTYLFFVVEHLFDLLGLLRGEVVVAGFGLLVCDGCHACDTLGVTGAVCSRTALGAPMPMKRQKPTKTWTCSPPGIFLRNRWMIDIAATASRLCTREEATTVKALSRRLSTKTSRAGRFVASDIVTAH